ncbi:MAG: hypothetical protein IKR11_08640, partial [Solobacterium sp.]|nr:hypothetical protein [Solobacterium sp.]
LSARVQSFREIIIGSVAGMNIDANYRLNIPSIHAFNDEGEIVMDFSGNLRETKGKVDDKKTVEIREWVITHKKEIQINIRKINHGEKPDKIK